MVLNAMNTKIKTSKGPSGLMNKTLLPVFQAKTLFSTFGNMNSSLFYYEILFLFHLYFKQLSYEVQGMTLIGLA